MRRRKWVLFAMGLAALLVAGFYAGWKVTRANEKLRTLLLSRIEPFVTAESGIQSLEINLSSVRLQGIYFVPKSGAFVLKIEGIEIGYRFWNVVRHGFSPQNIAHEIMVVHPVLVINKNQHSAPLSPVAGWESVRDLIQEFSTVTSITVLDAELALSDSLDSIVLANDLDGWLQTVPLDSAWLRLSGRFLESRVKNLHLDSRINLNTIRPYSFFWTIDPSHTPESIPLIIPTFLQVKGGTLEGSGEYIRGQGHSGFIQIGNGAFCFKNHPFCFNAVELRGDFTGNDMALSGEIGDFNGSAVRLSGVLNNLISPEMDIQVRCDAFYMTPFFKALTPKSDLQIAGTGRFNLAARGDLNNPSLQGLFHVDHADVSKFRIDTLHMALTLQDSVLKMTTSGHQASGFGMLIHSRIDFSRPQFPADFTLDVQGDILPMLPRNAENHFFYCRGHIRAALGGPLSELQGELSGSIEAESRNGGTLRLDPVFSYSKRQLRIRVDSDNSFLCTGIIDHFLGAEENWQFQIQNAELIMQNTYYDFYNRWFQDQKIVSEIQGNRKGWRCYVRSMSQNSDSLLWETTLETVVQDADQKQLLLSGAVYPDSANSIPFHGRSLWTRQRLQIRKFEFGDFLSLEGDIPRAVNAPVACRIRFNELSLLQLVPLFPRLRDFRGIINGDVVYNGSRSRPHLDAQIRFSKGEFHGLGDFTGEASGSWDADTLRSFRCRIAQDDHDIMTGYVQAFVKDSLDGNFTGRIRDFGTLIRAFTGKDGWKGQSAFSMQVSGTGQRPAMKGKLVFEKGNLGWLQFDSLAVQFEDTLVSGWSFRSNMLRLTHGHLSRRDGLNMDFQGKIPLGSEENMDIGIGIRGNVLHLLDDYSAFVRRANGQGSMRFRIRGRPEAPVLEEGSIQVENGTLELAEVVSKLENLNIIMMLDAEDRFLQILNFSGTIRNKPIRIVNFPGAHGLPVIRLESLGIHLGILSPETDPQGISVHIPGLMETRERGTLAFEGLTPDEPFLIAGGESGILLQGTLRVSDTRLTYPFLKIRKSGGKSSVVRFLEKIDWNLRVLPLSDVHYVRSIESPLGNVYADLQLKQEFGSLHVQGILDEGSFQVWGNLESTDGNIEVLDMFFRPERITFDYPRGASYPIVSGRSHATLIDSTGTPSSLWLTLTTVDDVTGQEVQGGSWQNIIFKLSSDNPNLARNEADLLSAIGYSGSQIRERAYDALGLQVENMVFRPLIRPLERQLRRYLGLDVVRFSSKFSSNFIQLRGVEQPVFDPKWLLRSSRVTLGKYLAPGFFVIYSGQVQTPWKYQYYDESLGFRHSLSIEYTFRPDLFLEMEYTYDSNLLHDRREDKRFWLKHVFPL